MHKNAQGKLKNIISTINLTRNELKLQIYNQMIEKSYFNMPKEEAWRLTH